MRARSGDVLPSFDETSPEQAEIGRPMLSIARTPSVSRQRGMKTQGEIEAAVCDGIRRFEIEYMGRGPKDVHTHLVGDLILIRMTGALTAAEQHLAKSLATVKGRDLLKQVRCHLIEAARPFIEEMILATTGVAMVSLHHDISTVTGEKILILTLAESPCCREKKASFE